jgi:hypothetical protein
MGAVGGIFLTTAGAWRSRNLTSGAPPTADQTVGVEERGRPVVTLKPPAADGSRDQPNSARTGSLLWTWLPLIAILSVAFAVRLVVALNTPIEGDSATAGLTALQISQGHLRLMEPNAHYQGTGLMFLLAPFVAAMGATAAALAVGMSVLGTAYVGAMFVLGKALRPQGRFALVLAGAAAIFPLFAITFGTHARAGYGDSLIWEALVCTCAVHIGWRRPRWYHWVGAGLLSGIGLWGSFLFALPAGVMAIGVLTQVRRMGFATFARGAVLSGIAFLVGFSPWLAFNLRYGFISLHNIPNYSLSRVQAMKAFVKQALPVFTGTDQRWPAWLTAAAVVALVLAALIARWQLSTASTPIRDRLRLQAVDVVLVLLPVMVVAVTLTRFNGVPFEPRYFLPAVVPLCVCIALALTARWPLLLVSGAILGAMTLTSVFAVIAASQTPVSGTIFGALFTPSWGDLAPWLQRQNVEAVYADYWIERPLQYLTGDKIPMAPYDGYLAFIDEAKTADAAAHPSYLFAAVDWGARTTVEAACALHGVTFTIATHGEFVLYTLSTSLSPGRISGIGTG